MGQEIKSIIMHTWTDTYPWTFNTFAVKRDWSRIYRSSPNATSVEMTAVYFNRDKGRYYLSFISKGLGGHNNIVYGGIRAFLYKNGLYKHVCNVIRFGGNK